MPITPAVINKASANAQNSTTLPTCSRRNPWRRTKAFCAPMATISPKLKAMPCSETEIAGDGAGRAVIIRGSLPVFLDEDKLSFLHLIKLS